MRITSLDFSFHTIQLLLLRDKLTEVGVDAHLVEWIKDYLTSGPQYVRLGVCGKQGTVLSPVLVTLYMSEEIIWNAYKNP